MLMKLPALDVCCVSGLDIESQLIYCTGSLADRITGGPETSGFSIRGSAQADVPGFSIRGASREVNPKVKELFPSKFSNGESNDLFADKMRDRNTQRRRAEDMM